MSRIDRANRGPSWTEVILGAVLSLLLGGLIGALLLILRPVVEVKPGAKEERDPKTTYFVPGTKDPNKGRSALAKRASFAQGQSVTVTEDELNALAAMPVAAPGATPAPGDKTKAGDKPAAPEEAVSSGPVNFRIRDGVFQVASPVTVNVLGLSPKVIVQSQGAFVKDSDQFAYVPDSFYLGSLPLQRLPFASSYVRSKFLSPQAVPEDVRASWAKLANVTIEGNALKLTMP